MGMSSIGSMTIQTQTAMTTRRSSRSLTTSRSQSSRTSISRTPERAEWAVTRTTTTVTMETTRICKPLSAAHRHHTQREEGHAVYRPQCTFVDDIDVIISCHILLVPMFCFVLFFPLLFCLFPTMSH